MSTSVHEEIAAELRRFPEGNLRVLPKVLRAARTPLDIRRWSPAIGSISDEDAAAMNQAIEGAFEQVDPEDW